MVDVCDPQRSCALPLDSKQCTTCGTAHVLCWNCTLSELNAAQRPLTDEVRRVVHIGICDEHGVIEEICQPGTTHYIVPPKVLEHRLGEARSDREKFVRVAAIGIAAGLLLGTVLGFASALALRLS